MACRRFIEYSSHYPTIMALMAALPFEKNASVYLSGGLLLPSRLVHPFHVRSPRLSTSIKVGTQIQQET